jgi:internalin A
MASDDNNQEGLRIALERIAREADERTGTLDLGQLGLTELPEELFGLIHLQRLNLGLRFLAENGEWADTTGDIFRNGPIANLGRLQCLPVLRELFLCHADINDILPLAGLSALTTLDCWGTSVSDLSPLSKLTALTTLECGQTMVTDLSSLAGLPLLTRLGCSGGSVSFGGRLSLSSLAGLTTLTTLDCSSNLLFDLTPLVGLTALTSLNCSNEFVTDLSPLAGLSALTTLDCSLTSVTDLSPLAGLTALTTLDFSSTSVADLSPLAGLTALTSLDCSDTSVTDLSPLTGLDRLEGLDFNHCALKTIPEGFWDKSLLREVILFETQLPDIPREVLSQSMGDNCLPRIRAHLRDMEAAGAASLADVKLMVLGNGRVGKTQICRRLRGEDYDEAVDSTHGIVLSAAGLPLTDGAEPARLNLWDFGGQDLYHGTHALFLRTRAVFLVVWAPASENADRHEHGGMVFRNHPLPYWLAYVRHLAGPESPIVIVQTRCDRPQDEARRLPVEDVDLEDFPFCKIVQYSARNDRGRAALEEALRQAVAWLREKQGTAQIGAGRLRVQRRLEELRDADARVPAEERQYRTLTQEHFRELCAEAGGVSEPDFLLEYLHHAGVVFYRRGLFGDRIVLDQGWALEAIYTVFHRERCYRQLRQWRGRFTRPLLELLVWKDYAEAEQRLFLDMMTTCGIVFIHRPADEAAGIEAEYIAPDLLPDKTEVAEELAERWDEAAPAEQAVYRYELHQPGLLRGLMAAIGKAAGINALYWKDGVCVFEQTTRSRALIEQEGLGDWRGLIRIRTQGGRAADLLVALRERLEQESRNWGLMSVDDAGSEATPRAKPRPEGAAPGLAFAAEPPSSAREFCVSYAWGDATPDGRDREAIVDQFCAEAENRGIQVLRDKRMLGLGDRISRFMQRIGRADRVLVVLSDKYLKSPYCMYELFEIWRNSRQEEAAFLERVRVYTLPDAAIFSPLDRAKCAVHWKRQHDELAEFIREHGADVLGEEDFRKFKLMQDFAHRVGDILATLADTVQPRDFEQLAGYAFDDD